MSLRLKRKAGVIRTYDVEVIQHLPPSQFQDTRDLIINFLEEELTVENKQLKYSESLQIRLRNPLKENETFDKWYNERTQQILYTPEIPEVLDKVRDTLLKRIEQDNREGSMLILEEILTHEFTITEFNPLNGYGYLPLPSCIPNRKNGLVNVKNKDDKCFLWCHVAHLLNVEVHPERITPSYKKKAEELNYNGVTFPVSYKDYSKIEDQNNINIFVFGVSGNKRFPIYSSKKRYDDNMCILHYTSDAVEATEAVEASEDATREAHFVKGHYVLIRDFNRFMYNQTKHRGKKYFCYYCLQHFNKQEVLERHKEICITINGTQSITLPPIGRGGKPTTVKYKQTGKELKKTIHCLCRL